MFWVWGSGFRVWIEFTLHLLVSKEGEESNVGADVENVALASLPMQGLEFRIYCLGFGVDGFEGGGSTSARTCNVARLVYSRRTKISCNPRFKGQYCRLKAEKLSSMPDGM